MFSDKCPICNSDLVVFNNKIMCKDKMIVYRHNRSSHYYLSFHKNSLEFEAITIDGVEVVNLYDYRNGAISCRLQLPGCNLIRLKRRLSTEDLISGKLKTYLIFS